jgi:hypothetical protein
MNKVLKRYLEPAFLICVLILVASGIIVAKGFVKKLPIPLKKQLNLLDDSKLLPYEVVGKGLIDNQNVVASLGTEDYIQWELEDTSAVADSPVRNCTLFITYYDHPDYVPHVPDECYIGAGYVIASRSNVSFACSYSPFSPEDVTFEVSNPKQQVNLSGRYLELTDKEGSLSGNGKFPVLYIFNVNGEYSSGRAKTRAILNKNFLGKHSYFSKVEWKFFNKGTVGRRKYPGKEEAVSASGKLLSTILPILEKEHWPMDLKPPLEEKFGQK